MSTRKHGEVYSLQGILSRANEEQGSRVEARSSVRGTSKRVEAGADADAPQEGVRLERNRNGIHQR